MQEQAQFSTVEGINGLQSTMAAMQSQQQQASSVALIGKQVTYLNADGTTASGVVSSVNSADGSTTVNVGGANVDPSTITKVADDPNATTESQVLSELLQLLQSDPTADPGSSDPTTGSTDSNATDGAGA
jgi:flagellar hook assembly protein FlgD